MTDRKGASSGPMQVHILFGEGKGKTSAAVGQALRCWGTGWSVLFAQFLKDASAPSGEVAAAKKLGRRWRHLRASLPCSPIKAPSREDKKLLARATEDFRRRVTGEITSGRFDAVVLDEALAAWKLGLLKVRDLTELRRGASAAGVRLLVLTGRWAPESLKKSADLVTELRKVRHPFDRGRKAVRGIDF